MDRTNFVHCPNDGQDIKHDHCSPSGLRWLGTLHSHRYSWPVSSTGSGSRHHQQDQDQVIVTRIRVIVRINKTMSDDRILWYEGLISFVNFWTHLFSLGWTGCLVFWRKCGRRVKTPKSNYLAMISWWRGWWWYGDENIRWAQFHYGVS